jgi:hypothetical protein
MTERWRDELTKLRRAELPPGLWDRSLEGPHMAPLPPRDPSRATAIGVAALVMVLAGGLLWMAFRDRTTVVPLGGSRVVTVPPVGETAAVFAPDGRPVFVIRHEDGSLSVLDGISTHHPWGFDDLLGWCAPTRQLVEWAHGSHFDEHGTWIEGPAPDVKLPSFDFDVVTTHASGDPATIRIGDVLPSSFGDEGRDAEGNYDYCPGGELAGHDLGDDVTFATPADAVAAAPEGYTTVRGTILIETPATGGDGSEPWMRLCGRIVDGGCIDGAPVVNIDALGLLTNVLQPSPGTAYEEEQVWLTRVEDGVLIGLGIVPPDHTA